MKRNLQLYNLYNLSLLLALLFSFYSPIFGQKKYEREYPIKASQIPEQALQFINLLEWTSKINWYREVGLEDTSVEAKTKLNDKKYSIEFNEDGKVEDVEVLIKWKSVPETVQRGICDHLTVATERFKIEKIQQQYTGTKEELIKIVNYPKDDYPTNQIKYELIVRVKEKGDFYLAEFLFNSNGKFISKKKIIQRNTDNIDY